MNEEKLYFSSTGTTGKPKLFGFNSLQIFEKIMSLANYLQIDSNDSFLCPLSFTHSHGMVVTLLTLLSGGNVHYLSSKNTNPKNILNYIELNKITIFTAVPLIYAKLLEDENTSNITSLKYAFCGSAPMTENLAFHFYEKYKVKINHAYGVSEIGPICINMNQLSSENNFKSIGNVLPYIKYKIINENNEDVETNEIGELIVQSNYMSTTYLNNIKESKSTFVNGWIYTKDLVKQDEYKNIYIIGRKTNFINIAGYKVYPAEIEKVLLTLNAIEEALVIGIDDKNKGQIIKAIVATKYPIDTQTILNFCANNLTKYKIPHIIEIVETLEKNSIEKVIASKYK